MSESISGGGGGGNIQAVNAKYEVFKNFISGGFGGVCCVATGHPFDTVKVRLQTMVAPKTGENPLFTGAFDCLRKTAAKEGFLALYKGMAVPIIGVAPLYAIFFGGCEVGRRLQSSKPASELTFIQNFNAGAFAGILTTTIIVPGERIKCILQVQQLGGTDSTKLQYSGPIDVAKKLYKEGGIRSLYRGTAATLLRDIPASGVYLSTYEYLKNYFSGGQADKKLSPGAILTAGGFAGIANWSVCIPADVLKSRLQIAPEGRYPDGIRGVFREIMREEGITALFKGFTPVMLRAFPANAACFFGLELALAVFKLFEER
uniref:Mitochondrial carnitine/acylcarnitine carrier protein n=1 Tax=Syphacia muris TaxID=451379 RepID=A0A0N5AVR0_9BILA